MELVPLHSFQRYQGRCKPNGEAAKSRPKTDVSINHAKIDDGRQFAHNDRVIKGGVGQEENQTADLQGCHALKSELKALQHFEFFLSNVLDLNLEVEVLEYRHHIENGSFEAILSYDVSVSISFVLPHELAGQKYACYDSELQVNVKIGRGRDCLLTLYVETTKNVRGPKTCFVTDAVSLVLVSITNQETHQILPDLVVLNLQLLVLSKDLGCLLQVLQDAVLKVGETNLVRQVNLGHLVLRYQLPQFNLELVRFNILFQEVFVLLMLNHYLTLVPVDVDGSD